jgi:hypothetical protein
MIYIFFPPKGENYLVSAATIGSYAYFGTNTIPGKVRELLFVLLNNKGGRR